MLLHKDNSHNYASTAVLLAMAWSSVARCRIIFLGAKVSVRHFGASADMSGQFGTGAEVPYGHFGTSAEMSWFQSVLGPKCLDTPFPSHRHINSAKKLLTVSRKFLSNTLPEYLIIIFKIYYFSCYQLISEYCGENHVILLQTVAKLWCIKLCAFFWSLCLFILT